MLFGYKASAEQFSPRQLLELGVLAEKAGFDSVVVSDHFHPWQHTGGHSPFAWSWLGALGERTQRVRIGTSVVCPSFRYNPAVLAQAMATLAVMYPGRVFFGVGTGEALNETAATGIPWPPYRERLDRFKEAVALMRELWREDSVSFEGRYFQTARATIYDRPAEGVPLYVAASGPRMAEYAGQVADGFITTSGRPLEHYRDELLPALELGALKAGRDPDSIEKVIEMKVSYHPNYAKAVLNTRQWKSSVLPPEAKTGVYDPREMEEQARGVSDEALETRWIVSHDPAEHVQRIAEYVHLGFTHLIFHGPGQDQEEFIRTYGEEILPRLHRRYG